MIIKLEKWDDSTGSYTFVKSITVVGDKDYFGIAGIKESKKIPISRPTKYRVICDHYLHEWLLYPEDIQ